MLATFRRKGIRLVCPLLILVFFYGIGRDEVFALPANTAETQPPVVITQAVAAAAGTSDGGAEKGKGGSSSDESKAGDGTSANLAAISDNVAQLVSLLCFIMFSCCFMQFLLSKINDRIPISIVCFIIGMVTYGVTLLFDGEKMTDPLSKALQTVRRMDSSVLYYIVLPILLYEATQDIEWYAFCNFIVGGISLAVVGVALQVLFLGYLFHYALNLTSGGYITTSFLLASILSSTDPVAVLSVLNGVNAHPKLSTIFNGESLINDGSSLLLFQFFYLLLVGKSQTYTYYAILFIKLLLLGPLLGVAIGIVVTMWLSLFRKHHMAQCLTLLTMGELAYFLAEYALNLSGPLAIVCYGIFIKAYGIIALDREAMEKHHHLVEGICMVANSAVFLISGALTVGMMKSYLQETSVGFGMCKLILVYFLVNLSRALMILLFIPLLSYIGYGINYKEFILLTWGGLRGALVLVLGLRLESDRNTPDKISDMLAFYISGNVVLIIIIQGLTFELLYRVLNPYPMKPFRKVYLLKVMHLIDYAFELEKGWLRDHWLFKDTDAVAKANKLVPLMASIKWNNTGSIEFDVPHVDDYFEPCIQLANSDTREDAVFEPQDETQNLTATPDESDEGDHEIIDLTEKDLELENVNAQGTVNTIDVAPEMRAHLENYTMLRKSSIKDMVDYNPTMYLRFLEHTFSTSQIEENNVIPYYESQPENELNKQVFHSEELLTPETPQRTDTDATINVENLYQRPLQKQLGNRSGVPLMDNNYSMFDNPEVQQVGGILCCPAEDRSRKSVKKDREGELYIMIFNAFSDMYNKLYKSGLIDGGSLLLLQNALDVASDFALRKLKKRSIAAWSAALAGLSDSAGRYVRGKMEDMGGFEFEWFVLYSMIERRMGRIDGCFNTRFLNFSQHNDVQSVLELLVAYIDVHQHLLDRGGRNLELLLEEKLLASYKRPIIRAKKYIATMKIRWPQHIGHGLVTMATCMMLRIKRDIVNEQSTQGLLLEEDRKKVVSILEEQLFRVATKHNRINVCKRFFRILFHHLTCQKGNNRK
ncbi:sodium/hydrogen exchanger like protein [Babesia gibsoni]|uniref:Sodium/hydrogen exchanger like protein n=1 Tax=Babesia gibsoni TaxID=33632 RepID=A0AAD8PEC2_BABGI|nr:sodium/hydrogen exchanger like protein [Babesia gibsoni]